jgi:hypothetical protein
VGLRGEKSLLMHPQSEVKEVELMALEPRVVGWLLGEQLWLKVVQQKVHHSFLPPLHLIKIKQ